MERAGAEELSFREIQFYQLRLIRFGYQWLFHQGILKETGKALGSKHWARLHDLPVKARCRLDTGELLWDELSVPLWKRRRQVYSVVPTHLAYLVWVTERCSTSKRCSTMKWCSTTKSTMTWCSTTNGSALDKMEFWLWSSLARFWVAL